VPLQVITGTTRQGRFSERVAAWVTGRLAERDAFEVELVDRREHPLTFLDGNPPAPTGRDDADEAVVRFSWVIDRADGYVILTAEYNHRYPAVLNNALDSTCARAARCHMRHLPGGRPRPPCALRPARAPVGHAGR
jgi:NAD(P)H-dependent FMN reductase